MDKLRELLPANRVAAIVGVLLAITAFVADLQTSLVPGSSGAEAIGKSLIAIAAIIKVLRIVEKFMDGSQNWDTLLLSGQPKGGSGLVSAEANIDAPATTPDADPATANEWELYGTGEAPPTEEALKADFPEDAPSDVGPRRTI